MIDYKTFIKSGIDPNCGISEFLLNSEITPFYKYLSNDRIKILEKEYTNPRLYYYKLKIWDSIILLFNRQKLLKNIIIRDRHINFEDYYIGMKFEEAMRLNTSFYNVDDDEDSIFHVLFKGIKFNLDMDLDDKPFISSIEVFDFNNREEHIKS
jgi:hypothetical protein